MKYVISTNHDYHLTVFMVKTNLKLSNVDEIVIIEENNFIEGIVCIKDNTYNTWFDNKEAMEYFFKTTFF